MLATAYVVIGILITAYIIVENDNVEDGLDYVAAVISGLLWPIWLVVFIIIFLYALSL